MFFMSLPGDSMATCPSPSSSSSDDKFTQFQQKEKEMFNEWCSLDENSVPPQYELRPLVDKDDKEFWSNAMPALRQALEGIPFDEASSPYICVGGSVTEWEALFAMKLSPERCHWFHRSLESGIDILYDQNKAVRDLCDFKNNDVTAAKYQSLAQVSYHSLRIIL